MRCPYCEADEVKYTVESLGMMRGEDMLRCGKCHEATERKLWLTEDDVEA